MAACRVVCQGLPRHLYIQKIYAERWIRPRYSSRFPFIRFRDRARALAPASGRRRRLDGAIEADFLLSDAPEPGSPLTPTICLVDQLGADTAYPARSCGAALRTLPSPMRSGGVSVRR